MLVHFLCIGVRRQRLPELGEHAQASAGRVIALDDGGRAVDEAVLLIEVAGQKDSLAFVQVSRCRLQLDLGFELAALVEVGLVYLLVQR